MKNSSLTGRLYAGLPYIILFSGLFVWFSIFARYILFFQEKSSLFIFSPEYLSIKQPGGFLLSLSELLTSFYYYPAAGALLISGIITLTAYLISINVYFSGGKNEKIIPFVAGLFLFLAYTDYTLKSIYVLGLLSQVLFLFLCLKTLKYAKGWIPFIIMPFWYFLTGGFTWLFVAAFTVYLLVFRAGPWLRIILLWSTMFFLFLISKSVFQSNEIALFNPMTLPPVQLTRVFFIVITGLIILIPVVAWISFPVPNFLSATYLSEITIRSGVVLSFMLIIGVCSYDRKNAQYFKVEKLFYEGKYDEIIKYNAEHPSANSLTLFFNNIALEEKGLLNDRLFNFLQSPDGRTLFLKWEKVTEVLKHGEYFYYTTGMINEAYRWTFESMVMTGHTPESLKMLVKTELISGNYTMAEKYVNMMRQTLFYRKDAIHFEKYLFNDPAVDSDPELGSRRKSRIKEDLFSITDDPYENFERLKLSESLNRNAFDYKIAFLLLKKDYRGIADNLQLFEKLGYDSFPVHVEEALLAITTLNDGVSPYKGRLAISGLTQERWLRFLAVLQQYGNDLRSAEPALRRQFGNTFWYWAFYR